jgi:DNA mismatch endonuclease (patch repair protein)
MPTGGTAKTHTPSFVGLRPASEAASRAKRASSKKRDTTPEVLLRRELWRMGLRYRKNVASLPGKPDIVFRRKRLAIYCDGDFWHGRDWEQLKAQLERRHNAAYWVAKIGRNRERDRENTALLLKAGWRVLRLWETDIKHDVRAAARAIVDLVGAHGGPIAPSAN